LSSDLVMRIVTRAELRDPNYHTAWSWPEGIPPIGGANRDFMLGHPFARGEGDPMQILALTGKQIVGRVDLLNGRLQIEDHAVDVLWASGLAVPERFRQTGAGLMLMLRMAGVHHTICIVGVSRQVAPIYDKLRWTTFPMTRYLLLRKSRPVLGMLIGERAAQVARPVVDSMLSLHGGLVRAFTELRARDLAVERCERLPDALDARLQAPRAAVSCSRSTQYVNWLLAHRTDSPRLCTVHDREGRTLGYFIVTSRFHESASDGKFRNVTLGSVKEWLVLEPERLGELELLLLATRELCSDARLDAIEICLPDDALGAALRRLGFVAKGELKLLFKAGPKSPLAQAKYQQRKLWWFRPADGDGFFF
jgi:hypothetical protein